MNPPLIHQTFTKCRAERKVNGYRVFTEIHLEQIRFVRIALKVEVLQNGNFIGIYLIVMLVMFSIGVLVGGIAPNMKVASALASLLYFPMLLFSGATLPYEILPKTFQNLADVLPLTQGIKLLKAASLGLPLKDITFSFIAMLVLGVICTGISLRFFKWE